MKDLLNSTLSPEQRAQIRPKWLTDSDCEMPIISYLACHRVRVEKLHYYAMVVTLRHESEKCVHNKKKAGTFQLLWSALTAASQLPSRLLGGKRNAYWTKVKMKPLLLHIPRLTLKSISGAVRIHSRDSHPWALSFTVTKFNQITPSILDDIL